jgi:outer membrane phospholipase A
MPADFIDEETKKLYESGHNILTKRLKAINNVVVIAESNKNISDYMNKHKNDVIKESIDPDKLIRDYKEKLKDTLTESEMSFVQQITDWRSPIAEQRKEKLFNKFKNECIEKLDEMLKEDSTNEELVSLKKQLEEQKFNNGTIVKDIAKLLEIRDILLEK